MTEYRRHPDLADDFIWVRRSQYEKPDTALTLHNVVLVQMLDRIDGGWVARLHMGDGMDAPLILRQCTDFNSGRHGAERWVLRHEAELRAIVAKKVAWVRREVAQGGRSHSQLLPPPHRHARPVGKWTDPKVTPPFR